jgi:hypothetical protein
MFQKLSFFALAATTLLLTAADAAHAQGPQRVPRLMIRLHTNEPLDWDAEGSVALIVQCGTSEEHHFRAPLDDYGIQWEGIVATLENNFPDLSDEEIDALATIVASSLGFFQSGPDVLHVRTGGPESIVGTHLFWDGQAPGLPRAGTIAHAGPAGDVLVLGTFYFSTADQLGMDAYFLQASDLVVTPPAYGVARYIAQLAIGWFSK